MLPVFLLQLIETEEDRNKMELLYTRYQRLMFRVANNIIQDEHRAEDAVNDAFVKVIDHLDRIDEVDCPRTRNFLVIIVRNISINIQNRKSRSAEVYPDNDDFWQNLRDDNLNDGEIEDRYLDAFELNEVISELRKLPPIYRDALYMNVIEQLSPEEISEIEDCSVETVRKRIYRAKLKLKQLKEDG